MGFPMGFHWASLQLECPRTTRHGHAACGAGRTACRGSPEADMVTSLKHSPWNSMVGRWNFLLEYHLFWGYVSFREGNAFYRRSCLILVFHRVSRWLTVDMLISKGMSTFVWFFVGLLTVLISMEVLFRLWNRVTWKHQSHEVGWIDLTTSSYPFKQTWTSSQAKHTLDVCLFNPPFFQKW